MIREAPAMTVRQNLGELLNEAQYRNGRVLITTAGKPVAALVGVALYERIRELDEEFDAIVAGLAKAFAGIAPGKGRALIDEALRAAPARRSGSIRPIRSTIPISCVLRPSPAGGGLPCERVEPRRPPRAPRPTGFPLRPGNV